MCCSPSKLLLFLRLVQLFDRFAQKYVLLPLKVRNNFVVKTIFHARGNSEVLTENYFATRKEAEEFCALTDYAMKLNYGAEQQLVTTEIVAL